MRNLLLLIIIIFIGCSDKASNSNKSLEESQNEWRELNHKDSIPELFQMALVQINNGYFHIANPNENFNSTDVKLDSLLDMRLCLLLERKNEWRISYVIGGFANHYAYAQCKIYQDSISELRIAESVLCLENNDCINEYLAKGKLVLKKVRVIQE